MLRANPSKRRQLSVRAPDLFWRDGETGREGLALSSLVCANPECTCREVELVACRVGEWLTGVASSKGATSYFKRAGVPGQEAPGALPPVLRADLDIDTGELRFAKNAAADARDASALEWLREEMDGPLLDHLAGKMVRGKGFRPLTRLRVENFVPGNMVLFGEAYLHGRVDTHLIDGRRLGALDAYCVNPTCSCGEMRLQVSDGKRDFGSILLSLHDPRWAPRFEGGPEVNRVWDAFVRRYPDPGPFRKREKLMKKAGFDIFIESRARSAPRIVVPEVGRNQPCPCGSGKKYKRCCLGKSSVA